jgi:hypothetical protein
LIGCAGRAGRELWENADMRAGVEARSIHRTPGGWEEGVQIADDFDA